MDASIIRSIEEIATITKAAGAKVDSQIAQILEHTSHSDARILDLEQKILTRGAGAGAGGGGGPLNLGALLAGDAKLSEFRAGNAQRIQIPVAQSLRTICRAILTNQGASGVSPATEYPTIPELVPGGVRGFAQRRLAVLEAMPVLPVSSAIAEVPQLVSDTDAAAVQETEGASKAETVLTFDGKQLRSATVATVVDVSKQLLSDSPLLGEFLRVVLLYGVSKKLENLIVTGSGNSTDQIAGFTTVGDAYTSSARSPGGPNRRGDRLHGRHRLYGGPHRAESDGLFRFGCAEGQPESVSGTRLECADARPDLGRQSSAVRCAVELAVPGDRHGPDHNSGQGAGPVELRLHRQPVQRERGHGPHGAQSATRGLRCASGSGVDDAGGFARLARGTHPPLIIFA